MSFVLLLRRSAFCILMVLYVMSEKSHTGIIIFNGSDTKYMAGDITESIPFAGTWKLSKVKDVKVDGVWIERVLPEGKNLLPIRFILNKSDDSTFFITASRENILFNFGEKVPGRLKDGRLKFQISHYSTGGDSVTMNLDLQYNGQSLEGPMLLTSETSEAMAEGHLSMKVADAAENSMLNGVFAGDVSVVSVSGDADMAGDLQRDLKMLIQYSDQLIIQVGDLAAFTWTAKKTGGSILSKLLYNSKRSSLFSFGSTQEEGTYIVMGYFVNRYVENKFNVKLDDALLKTIGVPEDPKHKKSQQYGFSRSLGYLMAEIYDWEQVLDDQGNSKTAEVKSNYQGSPVELPKQFLKVEAVPLQGSEIRCGQAATIEIKLLNQFNKVSSEFDGGAVITLLANSTPELTRLPSSQSVSLTHGIAEPVFFFTPKVPFAADKPILGTTVISGDAFIRVQLENSNLPAVVKHIKVKSPFDFYIDRIEVNQSVYGTDKTTLMEYLPGSDRTFPALPFISDHNTIIQVFADIKNKTVIPYLKIELPGLKGDLKIFRDDKEIMTSNLDMTGPTGKRNYLYKDKYEDQDCVQMQDAFYVYLENNHLLQPGTYRFQAILKPDNKYEEIESEKKNNELSYTAQFVLTNSISVLYYTGNKIGDAAVQPNQDIWNYLRNVYPLQSSKLIVDSAPFTYNFKNSSDITFSVLNNLLNRYNKENPKDQREFLVMVTDTNTVHSACGGLPCGGCTPAYGCRTAVASTLAAKVPAHELGHILGLRDTYKTDKWKTYDGEPNPRRSRATDQGNPVEAGDIEFLGHTKVSPQTVTWNYEFMGTGDYVDRVTWDYLYKTKFRTAGEKGSEMKNKISGEVYIAVSGLAGPDNAGSLDPIITLTQVPALSVPAPGGYSIEFMNSSGSLISSHSFSLEPIVEDAFKSSGIPFSLYLSLPEGTRGIVLKKGTELLASRILSQNPPQVSIITPQSGETIKGEKEIKWTGTDADGDNLLYDILYSPDGEAQQVVAVNVKADSYNWNSRQWKSSAGSGKITIIAKDGFNESRAFAGNLSVENPTGIDNKNKTVPSSFSLKQNFPNPFNPSTTIRFEIPAESQVAIRIYDLQGQLIRTLLNETIKPGIYDVDWNGKNEDGINVTNGLYFIEMTSGGYHHVTKALLIK